ncbi:MAG TPA: hypothetical protein VIC62_22635 [Nakamurella sp.]|jgi:hypothetical protein
MTQDVGIGLLVLHTLRCMGFSNLESIGRATGMGAAAVESELIDLAVAGFVIRTSGPFGGWGPTESGKAADADLIADELDSTGARAAVTEAYGRFEKLNPQLLDACSRWQTRRLGSATIANDHSDSVYDARVLDRFASLHRRIAPVCDDLTAALHRFGRYRPRLADALARAESGELRHVTDDTASYHSVWFQLHEDLLVTLGRTRWGRDESGARS